MSPRHVPVLARRFTSRSRLRHACRSCVCIVANLCTWVFALLISAGQGRKELAWRPRCFSLHSPLLIDPPLQQAVPSSPTGVRQAIAGSYTPRRSWDSRSYQPWLRAHRGVREGAVAGLPDDDGSVIATGALGRGFAVVGK